MTAFETKESSTRYGPLSITSFVPEGSPRRPQKAEHGRVVLKGYFCSNLGGTLICRREAEEADGAQHRAIPRRLWLPARRGSVPAYATVRRR